MVVVVLRGTGCRWMVLAQKYIIGLTNPANRSSPQLELSIDFCVWNEVRLLDDVDRKLPCLKLDSA